jgi:hypothetical protein
MFGDGAGRTVPGPGPAPFQYGCTYGDAPPTGGAAETTFGCNEEFHAGPDCGGMFHASGVGGSGNVFTAGDDGELAGASVGYDC